MPFNNAGNGITNEVDFVKYINNKKIKDLNILFQIFVKDIYGYINYDDKIYAWKNHKTQKTDIYIKIGKIIKRVSIKKGVKNSVHVEGITNFIHFLIENKVDKTIIVEYLKYQYADGTTNGTGKKRLSVIEYKKIYQDKIDLINKNLNNEKLLKKIVERFITKGNNDVEKIDVLIYGVIDDFIWIKASDIEKIILSKIDVYSSGVHFGPLSCQPMDRCLNKNPLYEKKRFCVQIKWYNLGDDIIENMNNNICKCI